MCPPPPERAQAARSHGHSAELTGVVCTFSALCLGERVRVGRETSPVEVHYVCPGPCLLVYARRSDLWYGAQTALTE